MYMKYVHHVKDCFYLLFLFPHVPKSMDNYVKGSFIRRK
ncbi:hypothetical protein C2W58_02159 [Bacillus pumilus]|uniref:Uncharacterized protein n=1 Tax=Bacillus pumilus TaxID=1408 RepID=A0AB34QZD9_BACPU|nr:hypothetical protein B4127_1171 [Bacillus pumilus]RAP04661.1 hypothetical protein C2W58_02159 [Bacillus pumilus]